MSTKKKIEREAARAEEDFRATRLLSATKKVAGQLINEARAKGGQGAFLLSLENVERRARRQPDHVETAKDRVNGRRLQTKQESMLRKASERHTDELTILTVSFPELCRSTAGFFFELHREDFLWIDLQTIAQRRQEALPAVVGLDTRYECAALLEPGGNGLGDFALLSQYVAEYTDDHGNETFHLSFQSALFTFAELRSQDSGGCFAHIDRHGDGTVIGPCSAFAHVLGVEYPLLRPDGSWPPGEKVNVLDAGSAAS